MTSLPSCSSAGLRGNTGNTGIPAIPPPPLADRSRSCGRFASGGDSAAVPHGAGGAMGGEKGRRASCSCRARNVLRQSQAYPRPGKAASESLAVLPAIPSVHGGCGVPGPPGALPWPLGVSCGDSGEGRVLMYPPVSFPAAFLICAAHAVLLCSKPHTGSH